jgi:hypothetical protein
VVAGESRFGSRLGVDVLEIGENLAPLAANINSPLADPG